MIIQSDREAAEVLLKYLCSPTADMPYAHLARHFADYRAAILSDDRVEEASCALTDHLEQFAGVGLSKSQADAAIRAVLKVLRGEA